MSTELYSIMYNRPKEFTNKKRYCYSEFYACIGNPQGPNAQPGHLNFNYSFKGEVYPKMKVSYMAVFGARSRMVKVPGACDEPFWVYKRLTKLRRPPPPPPPRRIIDDVLVVEELAVTPHGNASSSHWRAARALAPVCVSHHTYRWLA